MISTFDPPAITDPQHLIPAMQGQGFAVVPSSLVHEMAMVNPDVLSAWKQGWNDLPPDNYLKDGGRYRRRRHSSFVVDAGSVRQVGHRPHWQPLEYNALHGGIERHFEPMPQQLTATSDWKNLLSWLGSVCSSLRSKQPWFAEAHQFRIDTTDGIGRPTPEGAHRDGVDLVAVFLVGRTDIKGGETRVFSALGPQGLRFTLCEPWSVLLLDDQRVIHESTPVQPTADMGYRDTLVITLRSGGFQEDLNAH